MMNLKKNHSIIYSRLHLLGYDHLKLHDYKKMLNEEQKIFESVKKLLN